MARPLSIRTIHTKVYGISNYQDAAKSVRSGDELTLGRDDQNEYDANAIGIVNKRGQLLGYINRDIAEDLAPKIDANRLGGICFASDVTGGGDRTIGVNILLVIGPIDAPDEDMYAMAAEALGIKLSKTQPPKPPRKPILKPLILGVYRLLKRLICCVADQLGMSPLLVTGIIVVTLAIAIVLSVALS